ncbi:Hypp8927 [Branchiostoma lanceolatum]|uniref:Hypp8927 protein n=1 Tax=Branchiostoma lanceolatum TaxID=7740 RepID=A0A8K0EGM1_BRALA|nr:Hypp8927 [Branchiostoma lanceolatum]
MEAWITACVLGLTLIQTAVAEVRVCRLDADCRPDEYCTGVTTGRSDGYCVPRVGARPCVRDRDCPVDEFCSFQGQLQQGFCTTEGRGLAIRGYCVPRVGARPCVRDRDCPVDEFCSFQGQLQQGFCTQRLDAIPPKYDPQRLDAIPPQYDPLVVGYPFGSLRRCFGDADRGDRTGCPPWEYCSDQTGRTEGYCLGQDCYSNTDCEGVTCNGGAVNPRIRGYCSLPQVPRTQLNLEPQPGQQGEPSLEEAGTTSEDSAPKDEGTVSDEETEELTGEEAGAGLDISPKFRLQFVTEKPDASQES